MKEPKKILLFVDKMADNDGGGMTNDLRKAEYLLAVHNLSFKKILEQTKKSTALPSGMFHTGRWVVAFNIDWNLTKVNFGFINYEIDLDENFDVFADTLSPQSVQGYFDMQQIIKKKTTEELESVELSDDDLIFEEYYSSYINYTKR